MIFSPTEINTLAVYIAWFLALGNDKKTIALIRSILCQVTNNLGCYL